MPPSRNFLIVVLLLILSLVACGLAPTVAPPPAPIPPAAIAPTIAPPSAQPATTVVKSKLDETPRIAIESAFTPELTKLLAKTKVENTFVINGTTFTTGELSGKKVVLFLSQVSMVNAAMNSERLFNKFNVTQLIFSGIAGGVNPDLNVGDVTVPAYWAEYQENRFARQTAKDWQLPDSNKIGLGNFGMFWPQNVSIQNPKGKPDSPDKVLWVAVDSSMLTAAKNVVSKVNLNRCTANNTCLSKQPKMIVGGNGVSGPTFVDNAEYRRYVWETFKADALDMETASASHVALNNGVPFIAFRALSDLAGGGPGENEIGVFFQFAADNSAEVVTKFLENWSPTSSSISAPPSTIPVKFGVVLVGPYNDHGWSEAHYSAANYAKSKLPAGSEFTYLDKVNPADRPATTLEQVVSDMKSKGIKLILTTSDDFQTDTLTVAQKNPDITFINVSGDHAWREGKNYKAPANEGNFMGKMEYGKMIAGCAAALSSTSGKIAYLGPLINDETRRLASSAYLGAKYCWTNYAKKNAGNLKFDVKWIGFWFNIPGVTLDPTKVANDFYNVGNDVVLSGIDTTEALVVAGQRAKQGQKVWAIPYDFKDGCAEAPDICLGTPYFNWGPAYLKTIQAFGSGTWKQSWEWNGPDWKDINNIDTSAVGFTFGKALSDANKATVQKFIVGLADGSINLFKGPVTLQDGTVYVKDGAVATDKEIWYLPQLLQGMTGASAPTK